MNIMGIKHLFNYLNSSVRLCNSSICWIAIMLIVDFGVQSGFILLVWQIWISENRLNCKQTKKKKNSKKLKMQNK